MCPSRHTVHPQSPEVVGKLSSETSSSKLQNDSCCEDSLLSFVRDYHSDCQELCVTSGQSLFILRHVQHSCLLAICNTFFSLSAICGKYVTSLFSADSRKTHFLPLLPLWNALLDLKKVYFQYYFLVSSSSLLSIVSYTNTPEEISEPG